MQSVLFYLRTFFLAGSAALASDATGAGAGADEELALLLLDAPAEPPMAAAVFLATSSKSVSRSLLNGRGMAGKEVTTSLPTRTSK